MKKRLLTARYSLIMLWSTTSPVLRVAAIVVLIAAVALIAGSRDPLGWSLFCGFLLLLTVVSFIVIYRMISKELDK